MYFSSPKEIQWRVGWMDHPNTSLKPEAVNMPYLLRQDGKPLPFFRGPIQFEEQLGFSGVAEYMQMYGFDPISGVFRERPFQDILESQECKLAFQEARNLWPEQPREAFHWDVVRYSKHYRDVCDKLMREWMDEVYEEIWISRRVPYSPTVYIDNIDNLVLFPAEKFESVFYAAGLPVSFNLGLHGAWETDEIKRGFRSPFSMTFLRYDLGFYEILPMISAYICYGFDVGDNSEGEISRELRRVMLLVLDCFRNAVGERPPLEQCRTVEVFSRSRDLSWSSLEVVYRFQGEYFSSRGHSCWNKFSLQTEYSQDLCFEDRIFEVFDVPPHVRYFEDSVELRFPIPAETDFRQDEVIARIEEKLSGLLVDVLPSFSDPKPKGFNRHRKEIAEQLKMFQARENGERLDPDAYRKAKKFEEKISRFDRNFLENISLPDKAEKIAA